MKNFFVEYEHAGKKDTQRFYSADPVRALNDFHYWIQTTRDLASNRTVLRDRVSHENYKLVRLYEKYQDGDGKEIKSHFDLPRSANPNLKDAVAIRRILKRETKAKELKFSFWDECQGERPEAQA